VAEPTVIEIHNYAASARGDAAETPGTEVGRITLSYDFPTYAWAPADTGGSMATVDFKAGKTYVLYEVD